MMNKWSTGGLINIFIFKEIVKVKENIEPQDRWGMLIQFVLIDTSLSYNKYVEVNFDFGLISECVHLLTGFSCDVWMN